MRAGSVTGMPSTRSTAQRSRSVLRCTRAPGLRSLRSRGTVTSGGAVVKPSPSSRAAHRWEATAPGPTESTTGHDPRLVGPRHAGDAVDPVGHEMPSSAANAGDGRCFGSRPRRAHLRERPMSADGRRPPPAVGRGRPRPSSCARATGGGRPSTLVQHGPRVNSRFRGFVGRSRREDRDGATQEPGFG